MKNERIIIGGLFMLQIILWLGFLVHRSPSFPGSLTGGLLAVAGALLLIVPPLIYSATKRIAFFKRIIRTRISLGTLLNWHVYTSIVGAILAILHTGHRFESNLGIWLTAMLLLTVLSGFIGRYFLGFSSGELQEKKDLLNRLATEYNQIVGQLAMQPNAEVVYAASRHTVSHALNSVVGVKTLRPDGKSPLSIRALRLAESIADLEYAIKTFDLLKRRTARWLKMHIITSGAFYVLLILHVWSAIYFGLKYLR
ncbi:MAG: hypothetical protein ABIQ93_03490 [Saprospiraceae bacterium]